MDRRKFIKRVLGNERVSRIPRAVFGGGLWAYDNCHLAITDIIEAPSRFSKALISFYQGLDTDIIFPGSGLNSFPAEAIGGTLRFRGKQAPMLQWPIIHTLEDMDRVETVDILKSPYTCALIEVIRGLREGLPDRFVCATSWGPFTWAFILCDEELLKKKVREDKAFIQAITELGSRISTAFLDVLIREGLVDGISVPEGAVTLIPVKFTKNSYCPQRNVSSAISGSGQSAGFSTCAERSARSSRFLPIPGPTACQWTITFLLPRHTTNTVTILSQPAMWMY